MARFLPESTTRRPGRQAASKPAGYLAMGQANRSEPVQAKRSAAFGRTGGFFYVNRPKQSHSVVAMIEGRPASDEARKSEGGSIACLSCDSLFCGAFAQTVCGILFKSRLTPRRIDLGSLDPSRSPVSPRHRVCFPVEAGDLRKASVIRRVRCAGDHHVDHV